MSASAIPSQIRADLCDSIEDIGSAMGLLRESITDADSGSLQSAQLCAADALEIIAALSSKFSELADSLATWSNAGQCPTCGAWLQLVRPGKHQCPCCASNAELTHPESKP
jgi:hypothetical protein